MSVPRPSTNILWINTGPWHVFIGFTTSEKAFKTEMRRLKIDSDVSFINPGANATTHFLVCKNSPSCYFVCVEPFNARKRSREQYAALIAHEATHIIQDMRERLAQGKSLGEEAEAYLVQQIVQEFLQMAWNSGKARSFKP